MIGTAQLTETRYLRLKQLELATIQIADWPLMVQFFEDDEVKLLQRCEHDPGSVEESDHFAALFERFSVHKHELRANYLHLEEIAKRIEDTVRRASDGMKIESDVIVIKSRILDHAEFIQEHKRYYGGNSFLEYPHYEGEIPLYFKGQKLTQIVARLNKKRTFEDLEDGLGEVSGVGINPTVLQKMLRGGLQAGYCTPGSTNSLREKLEDVKKELKEFCLAI